MKYPILMADIIDSRYSESSALMYEFKNLVFYINKLKKNDLISPLTITLGDEFQGIASSIESAINLIFLSEEFLLSNELHFKLRYVLNYGTIDTPINNDIAYEMLGEGLSEARTKLNHLKESNRRFLIILNIEQENLEKILNDSFQIYQYFVDTWKVEEYNLVGEFLAQKDYKIIAKELNLHRSSTWRRQKSLNIEEYETVKRIIQNTIILYDNM